jgi:hypothetical protein
VALSASKIGNFGGARLMKTDSSVLTVTICNYWKTGSTTTLCF